LDKHAINEKIFLISNFASLISCKEKSKEKVELGDVLNTVGESNREL